VAFIAPHRHDGDAGVDPYELTGDYTVLVEVAFIAPHRHDGDAGADPYELTGDYTVLVESSIELYVRNVRMV
nr:hypothetical protein [Tanacetum cinerariifolium]